MDKEIMIKQLESYFANEYNGALRIVESLPWWCSTRKDILEMLLSTVQRCLGAAQFIQILGVSFDEVNVLYDDYRKKIMDLMDESDT